MSISNEAGGQITTPGRQSVRPPLAHLGELLARNAEFDPDWRHDAIAKQQPPGRRDGLRPVHSPAVFEPEEIVILLLAYEEACLVLAGRRVLGRDRRQEIARVILSHARRGLLEPRRLALKAIVKAG